MSARNRMETGPVANVRAIYEQWQEGKILDTEEKQALRASSKQDAVEYGEAGVSFAEALKRAGNDSGRGSA